MLQKTSQYKIINSVICHFYIKTKLWGHIQKHLWLHNIFSYCLYFQIIILVLMDSAWEKLVIQLTHHLAANH